MSIKNVPSRSDQKSFKILFVYSIYTVAPIFLGHDFLLEDPSSKSTIGYRVKRTALGQGTAMSLST